MKTSAAAALCALILLTGCTRSQPSDSVSLVARTLPLFPSHYQCVYLLDAYTDGVLTSSSRYAAVRTPEGFYYCSSTSGQPSLFLCLEDGTYAYYIPNEAGTPVPNDGLVFSAAALEQIQFTLLPLGILSPLEENLTDGGTIHYLGRPCRILTDPRQLAGQSRGIYYVDLATGLTLYHLIRQADAAGHLYTYELSCESFTTQNVALPYLSTHSDR